jgi:N-acetylmuramoyl-L-alanine amidase CwlA
MLHYSSRKGRKAEWIVCHYPAAPSKDADWMLKYYQNTKDSVSAHYAVSDSKTVVIVPRIMAAHHCATSNRKTYCGATNLNSIGIDLMDNKLNTKSAKVEDTDWYISEKTLERAANLIAFLMRQNGIDIDHVVRHYDVTHKWCPRPLVGDDINQYYGISGNERWARFKVRIMEIYEQ